MIVNEFKKSILQTAFEGNLTRREENDSKVENTIDIIIKEKELLVKEYKANREPIYKYPDKNECLFDIPKEWKWMRIGELGVFKKGPFGSALTKSIFVKKGENTIKVYEQQNAIKKSVELGEYYITNDYFEKKLKSFELREGDIIVSCAGTIGETYIIPSKFEKGIINQALMRMTMVKELNTKYFLLYFDFILKKISNNLSSGSAIKNIPPFELFKQLLIPLPPKEEQQRIVDKIEETFKKLDELKPIEDALNELKIKFPTEMIISLMQEAISGKLTEQNVSDNCEDIIGYIEKTTNKKINKIDNGPFNIPDNWKWIKFGDLVTYSIGKTPPRADMSYWGENKYNWVSISDMIPNEKINFTKELVSEYASENIFKNKISKKGTLIMSFKLTVGRCSILDMDAYHNEGIISIYPNYESETLKMYLFKVLPYITKYGDTKGAIKGNTLNSKSLTNLLIPLPPIEEQQRIVDKIEQLLPLCYDIEKLVNN